MLLTQQLNTCYLNKIWAPSHLKYIQLIDGEISICIPYSSVFSNFKWSMVQANSFPIAVGYTYSMHVRTSPKYPVCSELVIWFSFIWVNKYRFECLLFVIYALISTVPQAAPLSDYHSAPDFWRLSSRCFIGSEGHTCGRQNAMSKGRARGYPSGTYWHQSLDFYQAVHELSGKTVNRCPT